MERRGYVEKVKGKMALVRFGRPEGCGECRRCGLGAGEAGANGGAGESDGGPTGAGVVWVLNLAGAEPGTPVRVELGGRGFLEAAFLAYILPLLAAAAGYWAGGNSGGGAGAAWGGLAGFGGALLFLRWWTARFPGEPAKVVGVGKEDDYAPDR